MTRISVLVEALERVKENFESFILHLPCHPDDEEDAYEFLEQFEPAGDALDNAVSELRYFIKYDQEVTL